MLALFLNLFFAWWLWEQAKDHFEAGRNWIGWAALVISAANFAAGLALVL